MRVGGEDVAGSQVERLDARGAWGADDELVEHHVDLLKAPLGGFDHPFASAHVFRRPVQDRLLLRLLRRHLGGRRAQRQRRVVGVDPRAGPAAEELLRPFVVQLGFRLLRLLDLQSGLRLRQLGAAGGREGSAGDLLQDALCLFQLSLRDEALRRQVALLQRHERLAGHDVVAFAHMDVEDSTADA